MVVEGKRVLRCAITDLGAQGLDSPAKRRLRLTEQVRRWAFDGVDIVQLREKGLESGELFELAETAIRTVRKFARRTAEGAAGMRLLVNGRADIAAAARADGVHLTGRAGELTSRQARQVFAEAGRPGCTVSVSCHSVENVVAVRQSDADLILFGPVFEKRIGGAVVTVGRGLKELRAACGAAGSVPVLALGGVTQENAPSCLEAGAAGFAAIRLFE